MNIETKNKIYKIIDSLCLFVFPIHINALVYSINLFFLYTLPGELLKSSSGLLSLVVTIVGGVGATQYRYYLSGMNEAINDNKECKIIALNLLLVLILGLLFIISTYQFYDIELNLSSALAWLIFLPLPFLGITATRRFLTGNGLELLNTLLLLPLLILSLILIAVIQPNEYFSTRIEQFILAIIIYFILACYILKIDTLSQKDIIFIAKFTPITLLGSVAGQFDRFIAINSLTTIDFEYYLKIFSFLAIPFLISEIYIGRSIRRFISLTETNILLCNYCKNTYMVTIILFILTVVCLNMSGAMLAWSALTLVFAYRINTSYLILIADIALDENKNMSLHVRNHIIYMVSFWLLANLLQVSFYKAIICSAFVRNLYLIVSIRLVNRF